MISPLFVGQPELLPCALEESTFQRKRVESVIHNRIILHKVHLSNGTGEIAKALWMCGICCKVWSLVDSGG